MKWTRRDFPYRGGTGVLVSFTPDPAMPPDAVVSQLASLPDVSDEALIGESLEGIILFWNRAAERIFDRSSNEMIGKPALPLVPSDFRGQLADIRARVLQGERIHHLETMRFAGGGERLRLTLSAAPVRDEAGAIVGTLHMLRALNEESIELQLAELEQLYANAPAGLGFVDRQHRFIRLNERLAKINGLPVSEHLGRRLSDIVPELSEVLQPIIEQVIRSGEPVLDREIRGTTRADPGATHVWLAGYHPVKGARGEVLGVNVVVEDITALIAAENKLQGTQHQLEIALAQIAEPLIIADNDWRLT